MWHRSIQIFGELTCLLVAVWIFASSFKPQAAWAFGNRANRPIKPRALLVMRILAAVAFVLSLVVIVTDLLDWTGYIHVVEGR